MITTVSAPIEYVPPLAPTRDWPRTSILVVGVLEVLILLSVNVPVVTQIGGFWLLLLLPTQLLFAKVNWRTTTTSCAFFYSIATTLLGVMVLGLFINTVLPWVGIDAPLARIPVSITSIIALAGLFAWRPTQWRWSIHLKHPIGFRACDIVVASTGILLVFLAVIGAIRLNNGASSALTVVMLIGAAALIVALIGLRSRLHPGTISVAIYLISSALLLMTSMRGWYTTGHDIQREYKLFELTKLHSRWDISLFRDPYNACMSITILPTIMSRLTRMPDGDIYKVPFQMIFALCPVIVYRLAARFGTRAISLIAVVFFVSFPTYFTDMPFENRQEIAFLFLGVCLLSLTERNWTDRKKYLLFTIFGIGMLLSHYSTTYVFLGVLVLTWLGWIAMRLVNRWPKLRVPSWVGEGPRPISRISLAALIFLTFLWAGPLTRTNGQLDKTITDTAAGLFGESGRYQYYSSDTSYSLLSAGVLPPAQRLNEYAQQTVKETAAERHQGALYPLSEVDRYGTPIVPDVNLPITSVGNAFDKAHIPVSTLNSVLREGPARLLQLLVCVGLILTLFRRRRAFAPDSTFWLLGGASLLAVVVLVVLPQLSVDYGLFRALQQAFFILAPFDALALVWLLHTGARRLHIADSSQGVRAATAVVMVFFLSFTGVIPQLLGGYPPQLQLNNSGDYYDSFYVHEQELVALNWLQGAAGKTFNNGVQSEVETDQYAYIRGQSYSGVNLIDDVYPTLVRRSAYVFLGYSTVTKDEATVSYGGDLITYSYPIKFLNQNKDLIYSSNGARIYK